MTDPRLEAVNQITVEPAAPGGRRILIGAFDGQPGAFVDHARAFAQAATRLRRDVHELLSTPIGDIARGERSRALGDAAVAEGEALAIKVQSAEAAVEQTAAAMSAVRPARDLAYAEVMIEFKLLDRLTAMSPIERAKVVTLAQADPINHAVWAEALVRAPVELSGITAVERASIGERLAAQRDPVGAARIARAREQSALARRAAGALLGFAREAGANVNGAPTLVRLVARAA